MSKPAYAANLTQKAFCNPCRSDRWVRVVTPWEPCTGAGRHRLVACGICGTEFRDWRDCMHREGDLDCQYRPPPTT